MILLCTPKNPTGVPISHVRIQAFLQAVGSSVLVMINEAAYVEYTEALERTSPTPRWLKWRGKWTRLLGGMT